MRSLRAFWIVPYMCLCGCGTALLAEPWPCDRIEDRPEVDTELMEMKHTQEAILWDGQKAIIHQPGEEGLYRATREMMIEYDSVCTANRVLAGHDASKLKPIPFWVYWWRIVVGWF